MLSRSIARSVAPLVSARAAHTDKHMPDLQYFRKQAKLKNILFTKIISLFKIVS